MAVLLATSLAACATQSPKPASRPKSAPSFALAASSAVAEAISFPEARGGGPAESNGAATRWTREETLERLASARCEHARSCRRIGPLAPYATFDECLRAERRRTAETYGVASCPSFDFEAAKGCVEGLRKTTCEDPASASRCTPTEVCRMPGEVAPFAFAP